MTVGFVGDRALRRIDDVERHAARRTDLHGLDRDATRKTRVVVSRRHRYSQRAQVPKGEAILCIHIPAHRVVDHRSELYVRGMHKNRGKSDGDRDDEASNNAAGGSHGNSIAGIRVA